MKRYLMSICVMLCVIIAAFQNAYVAVRIPGTQSVMLNTWKTGCVIFADKPLFFKDVIYTGNRVLRASSESPWRMSGHIVKYAILGHYVVGYCQKNPRSPISIQGYFVLNCDNSQCDFGMTYDQYMSLLRRKKIREPQLVNGALRPYHVWLGWANTQK